MKGRTLKRGASWSFVVDLPPRPDGRRNQRMKGGFRTRKDAESALAEMLTEAQRGNLVAPGKQTLSAWLPAWLDGAAPALADNTVKLYSHIIQKWIIPRIGGVRLDAVTPAHLQGLYTDLSAGGLSPRSVHLTHIVLRRAFSQAADWRLIGRNPTDAKLTRPKPDEKEGHRAWTAEEARRFLSATDGHRLAPMWAFFLATGLRRGEVLGLRWEDVDMEKGYLRVTRAIVSVNGTPTVSPPKTKGSRRVVWLSDDARNALLRRRANQAKERLAAGTAWEDSGLVFTTALGGLIHPQNIRRAFESAQKRAGVPRLTPHGLRHTFGSIALEAGVHPKLVQEMLGHSSAGLTLDVYTHTTPALHREAIGQVGAALRGLG